ncbi:MULTISPECIES: bifunctional cytidylyltransferase/SDR family oxidoreductase [unclassified Leifsonia]|uniref:bifunctional cytidylyltransferase/SDR family oxidoreductase n=1 Tax=unclassified Leifsonia TaxID=2663824 RepID=UPI000B26EFEC|nr:MULTISPECIES: bifunctional cytidylyltransferase/SDR family oxidoreductase [unclassified Leifsonia]
MSTVRPRNVAVVLAGGVGVRVGLGIPKQLIRIAGKAIVEHTLETLNDNPLIDEVIVMMNAASIRELDYIRDDPRYDKLTAVLPGGDTRNDTTKLALDALPADEEINVIFHDAVRPFIDDRIIADCVSALEEYQAVDTAIPSADTIIEVDESRHITGIPVRSTLRRGQTPQAFHISAIRRAYAIAADDPDFAATDDCGVVFKYTPEVPIYVVDGTPENMKVTEPLDIHIADKIFQLQTEDLSSPGGPAPDEFTGKTVVVLGASYGIGASIVDGARSFGADVFAFSRSTTGTDITSRKAVRAALATAAEATGRIDFVIVTAGILSIAPLNETKRRDLRRTLDVNLAAPAKIAQEAYSYLEETQGQLVYFTSSSYTRGRAGYSLYSATKAGIVNLTQALADEWADAGVKVNCVNPQRTSTPMRTRAFGEEPAGTLLEAETVANVTLKLLTTDLTGQVINVVRGKD